MSTACSPENTQVVDSSDVTVIRPSDVTVQLQSLPTDDDRPSTSDAQPHSPGLAGHADARGSVRETALYAPDYVADTTLYEFLGAASNFSADELEAAAHTLCHRRLVAELMLMAVPHPSKSIQRLLEDTGQTQWGRSLKTDDRGKVTLTVSGEFTLAFSRTRGATGSALAKLVDACLAYLVLEDFHSQRRVYNTTGVSIVYLIENEAEREARVKDETKKRNTNAIWGAIWPGIVCGTLLNPALGLLAAGAGALATHVTEKVIAVGAHQIHPSVLRILNSYIVYMEVRAYHLVRDDTKRVQLNMLRGMLANNTMRAGSNVDHHYVLCETVPLGQTRSRDGANSTWLLVNNDSDGHIVMKTFATSADADMFTLTGKGLFDSVSTNSVVYKDVCRLGAGDRSAIGKGASLLHKKNMYCPNEVDECWTVKSGGIHAEERGVDNYFPRQFRGDVNRVLAMQEERAGPRVILEVIDEVHTRARREHYPDVSLDNLVTGTDPKSGFHTNLLAVEDLRLKTVRELVYFAVANMKAYYSLCDDNCQKKSSKLFEWYQTRTKDYSFSVRLPG